MSAENKERLCGDNINDRSVCGQTRLSLQQIHLQNKCINVLILRPESAWRGVAIMAHNGVEWFIKSHFYVFNISVMAQSIFLKKKYRQMLLHKFYDTNVFAILSNIPDISSQELVLCQRGSQHKLVVVAKIFKRLLQSFLLFSFFLELHSAVQCSGSHQNVCMHV